MSDYGSPSGPPGGPPGPPPVSKSPMSTEQQTTILSYVAAGLGVLAFIWGFLDWYKSGGTGVGGYSVEGGPAAATIGLCLVAGLMAGALVLEKKPITLTPVVISIAGLLIALGVLIGHGSVGEGANVGSGIGLILQFVTAIVQAAVLAVAWLVTTGKMAGLAPKQKSEPWQQGGGYPGAGGSYPAGGGGYPGGPGQPGQYGPPPGAPQYGPPPGAPQYGPPSGGSRHSAPQGPPTQQTPPPPAPQGPPPPPPPQGPPPGYGAPPRPDSTSTQQFPSVGGYGPPPQDRPEPEGQRGYGQ